MRLGEDVETSAIQLSINAIGGVRRARLGLRPLTVCTWIPHIKGAARTYCRLSETDFTLGAARRFLVQYISNGAIPDKAARRAVTQQGVGREA